MAEFYNDILSSSDDENDEPQFIEDLEYWKNELIILNYSGLYAIWHFISHTRTHTHILTSRTNGHTDTH